VKFIATFRESFYLGQQIIPILPKKLFLIEFISRFFDLLEIDINSNEFFCL